MWILFKVLWALHLETIHIGQGHPLVHHLLTKLDQFGKLELVRQAEHFKYQLDAGETRAKAAVVHFEGPLVVYEVDHLLEGLWVDVVEHHPLVFVLG